MENKTKKAAIMTWCDNNGPTNYGQILQCYAMQYLFRERGYETIVVQYRRKDERDFVKHNFSNKWMIGRLLNRGYEWAYNIVVIEKKYTSRVKKFKTFIKKNIELTEPCYTKAAVEMATADCELLVCGSDQIWNPIWFDPIWFLDFGKEEQRRMAYAVSGIFEDSDEKHNTIMKMIPLIEKLDRVSVREEVSVDILKQYTDIHIEDMYDPVYQVPIEEWDKIELESKVKEQDYIFCYILGEIRPYQLILRELVQLYGVNKVICVSSKVIDTAQLSFVKTCNQAGPCEFISLIKYAKAVCTDSFHGTIMSILYQKPFYNVERKQSNAEGYGGSERIKNCLDKLHMESRTVKNRCEVSRLYKANS